MFLGAVSSLALSDLFYTDIVNKCIQPWSIICIINYLIDTCAPIRFPRSCHSTRNWLMFFLFWSTLAGLAHNIVSEPTFMCLKIFCCSLFLRGVTVDMHWIPPLIHFLHVAFVVVSGGLFFIVNLIDFWMTLRSLSPRTLTITLLCK